LVLFVAALSLISAECKTDVLGIATGRSIVLQIRSRARELAVLAVIQGNES
jgi:hypothetical protein